MTQITTATFFKVSGFSKKFWALSQMGTAPLAIRKAPGLLFSKKMGSGSGNGFSIRPDFSTFALLAVWEKRDHAEHFFSNHPFIKSYEQQADSIKTYFLKATKAHGLWDNKQPFEMNGEDVKDAKIAVLTRAKIKTSLLFQFWKNVPSVSKSIEGAKGLIFSKGIGERPLIYQATLSVWESKEHMFDFAYRSKKHVEMIKKTRELKWYSEELFAEFQILAVQDHELALAKI